MDNTAPARSSAGFTISKAEFCSGNERLKGKNVMFLFASRCTGILIAAAAKKIQKEMKQVGNPPQFPQHNDLKVLARSTWGTSRRPSTCTVTPNW